MKICCLFWKDEMQIKKAWRATIGAVTFHAFRNNESGVFPTKGNCGVQFIFMRLKWQNEWPEA